MTAAAAWLGRGVNLPLAIAAIAFAAPVVIAGDSYTMRLLTLSGVYALLGIGYHFAFGQAGLLSLAQGAFFGLGAYVAGILASRWGVGAAVALPLAIALPVLLAAVIALPVLRLASHYFALATLAVAQAVLLAAVNWTGLTGGANGLAGLPGLDLFGVHVGRGLPLMAATWSVVLAGAALAWRLGAGRLSLAWRVVRADPVAAASIGLDTGRLRLAPVQQAPRYAGAPGAPHHGRAGPGVAQPEHAAGFAVHAHFQDGAPLPPGADEESPIGAHPLERDALPMRRRPREEVVHAAARVQQHLLDRGHRTHAPVHLHQVRPVRRPLDGRDAHQRDAAGNAVVQRAVPLVGEEAVEELQSEFGGLGVAHVRVDHGCPRHAPA